MKIKSKPLRERGLAGGGGRCGRLAGQKVCPELFLSKMSGKGTEEQQKVRKSMDVAWFGTDERRRKIL